MYTVCQILQCLNGKCVYGLVPPKIPPPPIHRTELVGLRLRPGPGSSTPEAGERIKRVCTPRSSASILPVLSNPVYAGLPDYGTSSEPEALEVLPVHPRPCP